MLSKHIFSILVWSEFEFKICGAPKITVDDLKMSSMICLIRLSSNKLKIIRKTK